MKSLEILLAALAAWPAMAEDRPRSEVSLNGNWSSQTVAELGAPPVSGEWKPCSVPGYLHGADYQRAWFRRQFTIPAEMQNQRIKIRFGGVKFNSRVVLNGKPVGGCFGGYEPFEIDVTDHVRLEGANDLAVGCHDWTGVFAPGKIAIPKDANWDSLRGAPRDKILSPIGGLFSLYGIWDDVTLRACPAVHIQDVRITPSVRRGELAVEYTLANESGRDAEIEVRALVEDQGKDLLTLPASRTTVPKGGTATVAVRQAWKNPPLWSHADPHLLYLRSELSTGDRLRSRFGFREFWTEGPRFYLNGVRINLLATSWWPPHAAMTRDEIRTQWQAVKKMGCVAFRTHTQPWPARHYDVADEVGLLMIVEGAVWNDDDVYRIGDPVFWDNYARHLKAMVDRDKNRPSVIMWSLENEFFGGRMNDASPAKNDLIRMGRLVKQADSTRPILFESDGDPGGVADVIGIHYPHEYPDFTCWPNEAYWLKKPAPGLGMFLNGEKEFVWRKDKPLYLGEFLWIPSRDPSWHTVFYGDDAYKDYHAYRNWAKAEAWKMQILGYRHLEVGGISPWTVSEGGPLNEDNPLLQAHDYAYKPVAAYALEHDSRFFGGRTIARRLALFNDRLHPATLQLQWHLNRGEDLLDRGHKQVRLGPGEQSVIDVELHLPKVTAPTFLVWLVAVQENNETVSYESHRLKVYPEPPCPNVHARIGLFDPNGSTRNVLDRWKLSTVSVAKLEDIPESVEVLLIGAGTLVANPAGVAVIGQVPPQRASLASFTARGGRVVVLHQHDYPEGLFDISLTGHASTMTFPADGDHPILRGVRENLKFWRGDHLVAAEEPTRPTCGGFVPLIVSGSAAGIDHAPLVEQRAGRGCIVFCQMLAAEKAAEEPAAAQLLGNLIDYAAACRAALRKTAVLGGSREYRAFLRSLGLRFEALSDVRSVDLSSYGLLICAGDAKPPAELEAWVQGGGNVLYHRPPAGSIAPICRQWKFDLTAQPYDGPVTRSEGEHPLLRAIAREDLYWLGRHVGIDWDDTPRCQHMADTVFCKTFQGKQPAAYEVEDWKLEGGLVQRQAPGVVFATVGTASREIEFSADGDYLVGIVARGTPCGGVYPLARVAVDNHPVGDVSVSGEWSTVTVPCRMSAGKHQVSIRFLNDASAPKEDRNLHVDKLLVARDDDPAGVRFLTSPAAVAAVARGTGMVVIDELRWDTEQQNARKAARYAAALMTALGGDFRPRQGTTLECRRMEPQPGMPFFSNQGSFASLACSGYIKAPIEVAAAARYTVELVASGTPAQGVYPLVELAIDGRLAGKVQLTGGAWRSYFLDVDLPAGRHELRLSFVNDLNAGGEDRNVVLDKVRFFRE